MRFLNVKLILINLSLLFSCSLPLNQKYFSDEKDINLKNNPNDKVWNQIYKFNENKLAKKYVLERRLSIQRIYQLTAEQYFGTPTEDDCTNNIDSNGVFLPIENGEVLLLRLLSNKNQSLGDCLKENNFYRTFYIFYICNENVHEYRIYKNINDSDKPNIDKKKCVLN